MSKSSNETVRLGYILGDGGQKEGLPPFSGDNLPFDSKENINLIMGNSDNGACIPFPVE